MKLDWERCVDDLKRSAMDSAEDFAVKNGLNKKERSRFCLAVEETMEIAGHLRNSRPDELQLEKKENGVRIRMITNSGAASGTGEMCFSNTPSRGISARLRLLYETGYEGLEKNRTLAEESGVQKITEKDLKEVGFDDKTDAYVWTLQSYNLAAFDRIVEEDDEEEWQEISHSILANLSEDIRLFLFPDRTELYIRIPAGQGKYAAKDKYDISPEFEALFKVPVVKNLFQVKLVQMMYGGLSRKQKSKENLSINEIRMSSDRSHKGEISVLCYSPLSSGESLPTVVFFHGGADLFPALPYHYRLAEKIALEVPCKVYMVQHDLAPKYNPPIQILEGFDVYRQLLEEKKYHVKPGKIAVMGDSSGGTMAAAVALLARDGMAPLPGGQMLLYPSLDMRFITPSMQKYTDVPVVNADVIRSYRKIVHSDRSEGNKYYLSPAEAGSFKGLCDTYIETAEFDALHDEGVEYAKSLKADGVRVTLNETKGTVHSFDMAENSSILAEAMKRRIEFLKGVFG